MSRDLLIELGTEELPPTALKNLSAAFTQGIEDGLKEAGLSFADVVSFAAPRRLAVRINALEEQQALEQWLRRVPDDPGGLLRRKFRYQTIQRLRNGEEPDEDVRW